MNIYELTTNQKNAIDKTKKIYGKNWKEEIRRAWRTGVYRWGLDSGEIAELQHMRNTIGSSGLEKIK
ncbi:hypothetical protein [Thiolapillus sp.]|uniref:hypothetical protein n=1 Tax=Thiolapillus sp. TaxID=2017437 RepID=UPI003AF73145